MVLSTGYGNDVQDVLKVRQSQGSTEYRKKEG